MTHEKFRNPPIIEAVAALRFAEPHSWSEELLANVQGEIAQLYTGPLQQEFQLHLQAHIQEGDTQTTTNRRPARRLLKAADGSGLVGIAPGVLSVHVLKPYPGWEEFRRRISEVISIAEVHVENQQLAEVAIRYIDRIAIPIDNVPNLEIYFTAIPKRPERMPTALTAFQTIVESRDPTTGMVAVLTTRAVPPSQGESFVMMYDLNLVQPSNTELALSLQDSMDVLEHLHARQYEIFMDSITEQTKGLFQ